MDLSITAAALLEEEGRVRAAGTGIQPTDLLGCWQLEQVWPKGERQAAQFSGVLLRGLAAQLEIQMQDGALQLRNSVRLGGVELFFEGPGALKGRRPLLQFQFLRMGLRVASRQWWGRALPAPAPQRMPFFALIQRDPSGWLTARGRGVASPNGGWLAKMGPVERWMGDGVPPLRELVGEIRPKPGRPNGLWSLRDTA